MTDPKTIPGEPADRKAVLFCPVCGHDAPVDGDWTITSSGVDSDRSDFECPTCGHVVVSQPTFGGSDSGPSARTMPGALLQLMNTVVRHDVL